jgi:outer membrane protein
MKNNNYLISCILIAGVLVLSVVQFTGCVGKNANSKSSDTTGTASDSLGTRLPIAFVHTDSLMVKYKFSIDLNDALMKKIEDRKLRINQQGDKLSKEIADFQQKAQMNAFISQERQMQEQDRLLKQKQDLDNYTAQVQQEISVESAKMSQQVQDTIVAALKIFNSPKKYEFILSNSGTDNILYADDAYDITNAVVEFLNSRYVPSK